MVRHNLELGVHSTKCLNKSFIDSATKLKEDYGKNPCRKYLNEGSCNFGSLCMYSHITPDERKRLEAEAQKESESKGKSQPSARVSSDEEIQDWLRTCKKRLSEANETTGKPQETLSKDKMFPVYELSDCLRGRVDVPPSLLPPTPEDMQNVIIDGWG